MNFLQPHEMELIRLDYNDFLHGLDSTSVIVHWLDQSGTPDRYNNYTTEEEKQEEVDAVVMPTSQRADRARDVERRPPADQQVGDVLIAFDEDYDLASKANIWFEVPGLGNYTPQAKPPLAAHAHLTLYPSAQRYVQLIPCGLKR